MGSNEAERKIGNWRIAWGPGGLGPVNRQVPYFLREPNTPQDPNPIPKLETPPGDGTKIEHIENPARATILLDQEPQILEG